MGLYPAGFESELNFALEPEWAFSCLLTLFEVDTMKQLKKD